MDERSELNLKSVQPDLVKVIRAARQLPQQFIVTYGLRTLADEAQAVATGHSQTMHSLHLANAAGVSRAVDVTPLIDGKIDFVSGHEKDIYGMIAAQILAAAKILSVPVMWGGAEIGAWEQGKISHFRDWGHFQLDPKVYP